jgi:hypothetical protein
MRVFTHQGLALVAALAILTGCTRPAHTDLPASDVRPDGAHLTPSQVISIAKHTAETKGIHLTNYKEPEAHYEFTKKDKTWSVFFDGKVPMPGNHFLVWIDDQTQKAQLMPGD